MFDRLCSQLFAHRLDGCPVVNQRINWMIVDIVSRKPQNKSWLWRYLILYWVNDPRITVHLAIHIDKEITPTRLTSRNKDDKVWFCLFYLLVIRNWALHESLIIGSHKHQCKGCDTILTFSWHDKVSPKSSLPLWFHVISIKITNLASNVNLDFPLIIIHFHEFWPE